MGFATGAKGLVIDRRPRRGLPAEIGPQMHDLAWPEHLNADFGENRFHEAVWMLEEMQEEKHEWQFKKPNLNQCEN